MKILIMGAGVGGIACALGLLDAGHEVEVFEQAEQLRTGGNGMILWPNGTGILRALGVSLDGLGRPVESLEACTEDGYPIARIGLAKIIEQCGSPSLLVARGRLLERMASLLPDGSLVLGRQCVGIERRSSGATESVVVSFADGSQAEGDVLVGADGHRSFVRKHLFGDETAAYTGWASWHGITTPGLDIADSNRVQTFYCPAGVCGLHPVGNGMVHWVFETPWQDGELVPRGLDGNGGAATPLEGLRARFGSWASPVPDLLDSLTDDDISLFPHVIHRLPRWWGRGPITLAGDAAHALPPRSAMGVNQTLEDAWVLRDALQRPGKPEVRLREYENARHPRLRKLIAHAHRLERLERSPALGIMYWLARRGIVSRAGTGRLYIRKSSNFLNNDLPRVG
jgi:FAD-dependent urate hydroxylase